MKLDLPPKLPISQPDFLGRGWFFPIQTEAGEVKTAAGDLDVEQAVALVLMTPLGQRVMRPDFGSRLSELVFAPTNTATAALAESYTRDALEKWAPRIQLDDVRVAFDGQTKNKMLISIDYTVRDSNVPNNLVFPFYLQS